LRVNGPSLNRNSPASMTRNASERSSSTRPLRSGSTASV
jgi:hypothetical protein